MPAQSQPRALFHFVTDGDNYSPVPRSQYSGQIAEYLHHDGTQIVYWIDARQIPNAHRCTYLLDISGEVRAYYVAGWSGLNTGDGDQTASAVLLHPMSGINRQGHGHAWRMGPRKAYHVIMTREDGTPSGHPDYVPTPERHQARQDSRA